MIKAPLHGLHVLLMEDEFLIAMDVEQLCREHGAADVTIAQTMAALGPDPFAGAPFQAAILDVRLSGQTTIDFAKQLAERRIPFIFATGYADGLLDELDDTIADVEVVGKPYAGTVLIEALGRAIARLK